MAAKVILKEGKSLTRGNKKFIFNQAKIIENEDEISYYKTRPDFNVIELVSQNVPESPKEDEVVEAEKVVLEHKVVYTENKLETMNKKKLSELGIEFGLFFVGDEKKKEMIADILEAQNG